jgi:hypothetical protein
MRNNKYQLVQTFKSPVERESELFEREMEEFLSRNPKLPLITSWEERGIPEIWLDWCNSVGMEIPSKYMEYDYYEGNEYETTKELLASKECRKRLKEIFPINITSRLILWYGTFANRYIMIGEKEPTRKEYIYYFTLKGFCIKKIAELAEYRPILFYYLTKRWHTMLATERRRDVLKELLSNPDICEKIKRSTFVVPAEHQFILSTPQVYSAYTNRYLKGESLPIVRRIKHADETKEYFRTVLRIMKEQNIPTEEAIKEANKTLEIPRGTLKGV